jgi:predicted Ser/Thr protein kinase
MRVGEVLAERYELEELVGTGGMSSVFRAHDRLLDRRVALKVLHQHYTDDPDYVERFRHEARAVAALSHPNIVTVIDRGEHEGRQFIVFEYVDGDNLKRLIERRGPAPVATALELAMQIARGLSFAHQRGLVHRDVKPQNVLLNGDGHAKVTDFGIARSLDVKRGMTQTGTVLGTSDYIAPEQAQGQRVDEHSDIYSLGVVLYEILTAEVPFPGENFVAVAMRHINEPPPSVRVKRPDVPVRVDAAIAKAMAKNPDDRFGTMAAFCVELEECLAEEQDTAPGTQVLPAAGAARRQTHRRRRVSPWPLLLVLGCLLAIGAVVAYFVIKGAGSGSPPASDGGGGGRGATPHLAGVTAYDPFGSPPGEEHNQDAPLATDRNPGTYWRTETYHSTFAALGKAGVGLVLDAHTAAQVHEIGIATSTPGFTAQIKAGDSKTSFPDVVAAAKTVDDGTTFAVGGNPHRYYLIWITRLPSNYGFVRINEVSAN